MTTGEMLVNENASLGRLALYPSTTAVPVHRFEEIYRENSRRIYSLAFWMTAHELEAEELTANVFRRIFSKYSEPNAEALDRAFITELREIGPIGSLSLRCEIAEEVLNVRGNTKRINLEQAVLQLPATERLIFLLHDVERYSHGSIAHLLGVNETESQTGLHQARLRIRELLASMR